MTNDEKKTTEQPDCRADETLTGSGYGEPSIWY